VDYHILHKELNEIMKPNDIQRDWLNDYEPQLPADLPSQLHSEVKQAVMNMRAGTGMTIYDVAKVFMPFVDEERAINLAGSEITRAASAATNAYQKQLSTSGVQMTRQWSTNNDSHVCEICKSFDKQTEEVWGKEFPKGPPAHEGCRCDISLTLDRKPVSTPVNKTPRVKKQQVITQQEKAPENKGFLAQLIAKITGKQ
jgi:hypothetical protein